ncbi:efflux transporter outer membrane subunit [Burkholderia sp. LMU1-1-1.1]|uniref:efflux transporter outer membrane subunit n=1 Tax=Burkholderia sp. LMU1-1-1.1 TaxID=3135266 RepID=UPI0034148F8F
MKYLVLPGLLLSLTACSLVPPLERPAAPLPARYDDGVVEAANGADLGWRQMFADARLRRLIELSLENNRDLRIATLNVEAVRAQFSIADAARLPPVSATGGVTRQRVPADAGGVQEQNTAGVGLGAFEIDLFGRVRAQSEAAFARYLASGEGRRAAHIALVGAVADAYFSELLAIEQLRLTESTLADWRASLEIARLLKQARQNSGLDIAQAEGQLATAEADLEARRRAVAQARNALALLVGTALPADLADAAPLEAQTLPAALPAGLPSDLLTRRPDILQAEQALRASNADIGAARAAFFPQISLTASLGFASPSMAALFDGAHRAWSFSPQITQPLFQGGRLRAELDLARIRKSAAVADYERVIQAAFREVADGLAARATYGRQIEAQRRTVASVERVRELSDLRYRAGQDGRLQLLDAQRTAYAARLALLALRRDQLRATTALYQALGGGYR